MPPVHPHVLLTHWHACCLHCSPHFGVAHAMCLGLAPWLAAEVPYLVEAGAIQAKV
jgi:ufm1-conjugating enzyme 1